MRGRGGGNNEREGRRERRGRGGNDEREGRRE